MADGLTVTGSTLFDRGFRTDGAVRLVYAKISRISDPKESWPSKLELNGLTYDGLTYLPAQGAAGLAEPVVEVLGPAV